MKAGTQNHLKTKRLMRLLGLPLYRAVGILETLWLLCIDCCDEGNVGKFSDDEIADYFGWEGKPSALVCGLAESGWLDQDEGERYVVHDWLEHAPEFIRERVRKRVARGAKAKKQTTYVRSEPDNFGQDRTEAGPAEASPTLSEVVPSIPIQFNSNPTNSNPTNTSADAEGATVGSEPFSDDASTPKPRPAYSQAFETWYAAYPRHRQKQDAAAAFGRAIPKIARSRALSAADALAWLVERTQTFAGSPAGKAGQFVPYPASWLNAGQWDDDDAEWNREAVREPAPAQRPPPTIPKARVM